MNMRKHGILKRTELVPAVGILPTVLADADYPLPGKVWGIDISHWTGIVPDWNVVKASGCRFVIIKAMHGKVRANYFVENYSGAKAAGLPVSHYHWLCPTRQVSVGGQAREYKLLCDQYPPDFISVTDFEWTPFTYKESGSSKTVTTEIDDLSSFMEAWKAETDREIGIYSSPSYWKEHGSLKTEWTKNLLWIANYGEHEPLEEPNTPLPWGKGGHTFWQFTENLDGDMIGTAPGERRVDGNYFKGDEAAWQAFVGGVSPDPEPEPEPGETMYKAHNNSNLYLRTEPRVATDTVIILMPAGTQIEGTRIVTASDGGKWLETTLPQPGYCASWMLEYDEVPPVVGDVTIEQNIEQFVNGKKWIPAQGNPIKFVKAG